MIPVSRPGRGSLPAPASWMGLGLLLALAAADAAAAGDVGPGPAGRLAIGRELGAGQGWLGGDGAYSVPLGRERTLWLFGDTLYADRRVMVNNSAALQHGLDPRSARFEFFAGRGPGGGPASLFPSPSGRGWLWPLHGLRQGERLWLFFLEVHPTGEHSPFGFRTVASWLATVDRPDDPPDRWRPRWSSPPASAFTPTRGRWFGSAVLPGPDGFAYLYGLGERREGPRLAGAALVLARAPAARLDDFGSWRFHTRRGWSRSPLGLVPLFEGAATELSVVPDPAGGVVCHATELGLSPRILARRAPRPEGPFGPPETVHTVDLAPGGGSFAYAAKAHPELAARPGRLWLTYAVNTFDPARLLVDRDLYWPELVELAY